MNSWVPKPWEKSHQLTIGSSTFLDLVQRYRLTREHSGRRRPDRRECVPEFADRLRGTSTAEHEAIDDHFHSKCVVSIYQQSFSRARSQSVHRTLRQLCQKVEIPLEALPRLRRDCVIPAGLWRQELRIVEGFDQHAVNSRWPHASCEDVSPHAGANILLD